MTPGPHCIATVSGRVVDLADPRPDALDIGDIAHALSLLCRYGGHVEYAYSVAQHSVLVHDLLADEGQDPHVCLWGLLHDAHEAFTGDLVAPLKRMLQPAIFNIEAALDRAICERWDIHLTDAELARVHAADRVAYGIERHTVAHVEGMWDVPEVAEGLLWAHRQPAWRAMRARLEFLKRFDVRTARKRAARRRGA